MKSLETENWKKSKLGLITILISFSALHELDRSRVEVRNLLRKHGGKRGMELRLSPWLTQTVKTMFAVRCEILDRQDHFIAF
jgi:hypothetical protein